MKIKTHQKNDIIIFIIEGHWTSGKQNQRILEAVERAALLKNYKKIILDLSNVLNLPKGILETLQMLDVKIKESGGELAVIPTGNIGSLLHIVRSEIVLNKSYTVDDAVSYFGQKQKGSVSKRSIISKIFHKN